MFTWLRSGFSLSSANNIWRPLKCIQNTQERCKEWIISSLVAEAGKIQDVRKAKPKVCPEVHLWGILVWEFTLHTCGNLIFSLVIFTSFHIINRFEEKRNILSYPFFTIHQWQKLVNKCCFAIQNCQVALYLSFGKSELAESWMTNYK